MTTHLLPGSILPDGSVDPTPIVVTLNDAGQVESFAPLGRIVESDHYGGGVNGAVGED